MLLISKDSFSEDINIDEIKLITTKLLEKLLLGWIDIAWVRNAIISLEKTFSTRDEAFFTSVSKTIKQEYTPPTVIQGPTPVILDSNIVQLNQSREPS